VGDDLLALLADQEGEKLLGCGLVLGGLENPRARDVDHVAGVAWSEVGDLRVHVRCAKLGSQPIPVVLIHDAEGDGAAVDLVRDRLVVGIDVAAGVCVDALQPFQSGRFTVGTHD
jgi:hypothetical protein